ncbi:MAG: hypothetical protein P4M15_06215 [Alphaproteobacteria bacterium]|nr:hypothetical protein [Alphaproteobacteria bacterium]
MNALKEWIIDRWWLVQIYFLASFAFCISEMVQRNFGVAAIELIGATLAYVGPAGFINAVLARKEHHRGVQNLIIHAVIGGASAAAAIWLMLWSNAHLELWGLSIDGRHWVGVGILVALLAARKEDDEIPEA